MNFNEMNVRQLLDALGFPPEMEHDEKVRRALRELVMLRKAGHEASRLLYEIAEEANDDGRAGLAYTCSHTASLLRKPQ